MSVTITLTAHPDGFYFAAKQLQLSNTPTILGGASVDHDGSPDRKAQQTNGLIRPKCLSPSKEVLPLWLSDAHAELRVVSGKIYIRDSNTPFGTIVARQGADPVHLLHTTDEIEVCDGNLITLGKPRPVNDRTPANIDGEQLKPVMAMVKISQ
ncbi:hypothetical protein BKA70DRAFT_252607 [Coprinopsis sp. MPI-PUGE-AT-0042]|nr:hypothetical protein BKA70DRAFT_252607 [Coprinopsis sp. MPI-PUGE-AT-0042]